MAGNKGENVRLLTLNEALEQVDVHALKFVFQSRSKAVKLFWFCLFLGGLCAAGYYIYQIVEEFQSQPTATKVNAVEQDHYNYPHLYFCSRYSLDVEKLHQAGLSSNTLAYAASLLQKPDPPIEQSFLLQGTTQAERELSQYLQDNHFKTYADFYKWLSFNFSRVIGEEPSVPPVFPVVFVANPTYDGEPTEYRTCFQAQATRYTPNIGDAFYLAYEMKRPPSQISSLLPSESDKDFFVITNDHRVILEKDRINLRRNRVTTIRLSVKKYINLDTDIRPCVNPEQEHRQFYTHKFCRHKCYLQAVQTCHKCIVLTEDTQVSVPPSSLCTWLSLRNHTIDCPQARQPYQKCIGQCLYPCEYFAYEFSLTAAVINHTHFMDDRIIVWLYYEVDDGLLVYEEVPTYTWASMVSNIGGQLGLWCGASLLTGLELIYLLAYVSWVNWKAQKKTARDMEDKNPHHQHPNDSLIAEKENKPEEKDTRDSTTAV